MSGICGVWSLGDDKAELGSVLAQLERRGPDSTRQWRDGPVALGHTLLATTPEALVEELPLTDADSGCTITADVRLDNREELIAALDLGAETRTIGDGELILRAYLQWGEDCPNHLLGDFAFAIWDARARRLFCARDHMGMKQFNYCHLAGEAFVFATEDIAVLAHGAVPKALDKARLVDFLDNLEGYDFTSTFFDAIHRLAPAHSLTVDRNGFDVRRYWQLSPPPPLRLGSDQAYQTAFMEVFTEAVRCRLRHHGAIGAMLSGGLDSSSIVAVAADIMATEGTGPLKTFSAVSPEPETCPESLAIGVAQGIAGLDPTFVTKTNFDGMASELLAELTRLNNPFELHGTMLRCIYSAAGRRGVRVLLDGGAGDVTLTSTNRVASLLSKGKLVGVVKEVASQVRFWKPERPLSFAFYHLTSSAWVAVVPRWFRSRWRARRLSRQAIVAAPDLARRVGLPGRRLAADRYVTMDVKDDAERRAQAMRHPNLASGRERFDQLSSAFALECRDPFMDIRLIQFCLSLPPEQLHADGWSKLILRRAIAPQLPGDLAWRRGKEHLGWDFTQALIGAWPGWSDSMRAADSPLPYYLSDDAKRMLADAASLAPDHATFSFFALDGFLRRHSEQRIRSIQLEQVNKHC